MKNQINLWATYPPDGLEARDEKPFCPVLLRKNVPIISTLKHVEKAVRNTPSSESENDPLRENQISSFYRADSKCSFTYSHHLCCICDDAFAFEVCQDWFSYKQAFCQLSPLLQSYWVNWNFWMTAKLWRLILLNFCLREMGGKKTDKLRSFFRFLMIERLIIWIAIDYEVKMWKKEEIWLRWVKCECECVLSSSKFKNKQDFLRKSIWTKLRCRSWWWFW